MEEFVRLDRSKLLELLDQAFLEGYHGFKEMKDVVLEDLIKDLNFEIQDYNQYSWSGNEFITDYSENSSSFFSYTTS